MKKSLLFLVMLVLFSFSVSATIDLNTIELYYSFDDDDLTGNTLDDLSNATEDGTNNGATTGVDGLLDEGFIFDGSMTYPSDPTADWIDINDDDYKNDNEGTICLWFNTSVKAGVYGWMWSHGQTSGGYQRISVGIQGANGYPVYQNNDGAQTTAEVQTDYADGDWHHMCFSGNGTSTYMYIDGTKQTLVYSAGSNNGDWFNDFSLADNFHIGDLNYNGQGETYGFNGTLDEFVYFNKTLTGAEISELYNAGTGYNPFTISTPPPTINEVKLLNQEGDAFYIHGENIYGYANATANDPSTNVSYNYIWYKNGVQISTDSYYNNSLSNKEVLLNTLTGVGLNIGDNITLGVRVFNGTLTSNWLNTSITIQEILIDNCSTYKSPVMNMTYYDLNTGTTITATNDYSLTLLDEYGDTHSYSGQFISSSKGAICTNINSLVSLIDFDLYGEIRLVKDGYDPSYIDISPLNPYEVNNSGTVIKLYALNSTDSTITTFTIIDEITGNPIDDGLATMYQEIDGAWTVISSKYSDITGQVPFYYLATIEYKFFIAKSGYNNYIFYLDPILSSTYEIPLERSIGLNTSLDFEEVGLAYYPYIYEEGLNTFTFLIQSPTSALINYNYTLTYPSGTSTNSGTQGVGEQLTNNITIAGATTMDRVHLRYCFVTSLTGDRCFNEYYPIILSTNQTMFQNREKTYGLGLFERALITTIISLFIIGISSLVGQLLAGTGLTIVVMGYLVRIGFINIWLILIPSLIGLLLMALKPSS